MQKKQISTRMICLCGIFSVFSVVFLLIAGTIPNMQLVAYGLASLLPACIVMEGSIKAGMVFYIETSILAFFLLPNKLYVIPYILFFGHVGLWKWYFNNKKNQVVGFLLRMVCFNISAAAVFFAAKGLLFKTSFGGVLGMILFTELFLVLYDYGFDLALGVYSKRIRSKLQK